MGFFQNLFSTIGKGIARIAPVAKRIGSFVAKNHGTIANVGMGLANLSGNETAKKIAGAGLGVSNMITMRQNLNKQNAQAQQARMNAGKPNGIYNAGTGSVS